MDNPDYGSYLRRGSIAATLISGLLSIPLYRRSKRRIFKTYFAFAGIVSFIASLYTVIVYFTYGDKAKIAMRETLLDYLPWDGSGEALDIGTGSGLLAIGVAKKFPEARVTGADTWKWSGGARVGLTREVAEKNAIAEGVYDRITFLDNVS